MSTGPAWRPRWTRSWPGAWSRSATATSTPTWPRTCSSPPAEEGIRLTLSDPERYTPERIAEFAATLIATFLKRD